MTDKAVVGPLPLQSTMFGFNDNHMTVAVPQVLGAHRADAEEWPPPDARPREQRESSLQAGHPLTALLLWRSVLATPGLAFVVVAPPHVCALAVVAAIMRFVPSVLHCVPHAAAGCCIPLPSHGCRPNVPPLGQVGPSG